MTVGAVLINGSLEALRDADNASWIFYGIVVIALVALLRPWWQPFAVIGATVVFGFVVHEVAEQVRPSLVGETAFGGSRIDELIDAWVLLPQDIVTEDGLPTGWTGRLAYIGLVAAVLGLTLVRNRVWRLIGLVPVLYLAACVWANLLIAQPAVARYVLIGALLVGLMAYRPEGIFGKQRVEIV